MAPGVSPGTPGTPEARQPGSRRGRMLAESAGVEEWPVWREVNGEPAVTWMCTPDQLEELATGWLHGEGYIETLDDLVKLRPCATDLGFWAEVKPERVTLVQGDQRRRVLASGCGAVSTFLADPPARSEEHTSELQSQSNLVCRLLLEKKKREAKEYLAHRTSPR